MSVRLPLVQAILAFGLGLTFFTATFVVFYAYYARKAHQSDAILNQPDKERRR